MRYVVFTTGQAGRRLGLVEGESVVPLEGLDSLEALLALDPAARNAATAKRGTPIPLAQVTLHAPVRPKKNVFAVGRNYLAHAEEGSRARGEELKLPDVPTMFSKAPTAIADPGQTLDLEGRVSRNWDWEAELAVVIGTRCKNVEESKALDTVFGYTCLNDVTARDKQRATTQWFMGKTLDDTCPVGPWIVSADEIGDPQTLDVSLLLNGETKQHANTRAMIFSVARVISYISQGMTLEPGDVIATGTPEGVGFARTPPEFVKDGDVMEVVISKIGTLRNPVRIA
jgi:2-keto-4-pentenoate hydratase/2-oxohepta-3-ene-1,7-dioic acid hydratase in catechol pathway